MTPRAATGRERRTGRRSGESGTRGAILDAARGRFAEHGYDGATIRGIAADAGVDPALVHHFYGTKERLFVAAMDFPVVPSEVVERVSRAGRARLGEALIRAVLDVWERTGNLEQATALLRSAVTNERAAVMLRGFVEGSILASIAEVVGVEDAEYRASLVASQIVGLAIARHVLGIEPVASASREDLVVALGPTFQRYLTGDVRARYAGSPRTRRGVARP